MGKFNHPGFILRIAIAIGYVLIGAAALFLKNLNLFSSDTLKYGFGILLISYGIFRMYRAFQMYKEE